MRPDPSTIPNSTSTIRPILLSVAALAVAVGCRPGADRGTRGPVPPAPPPPSPLERRITQALSQPHLATGTAGILVVRQKDGRVLYEHKAEKLLPAASNVKLVSCAGALLTLGPDFRFETPVVGTGPVRDGVLEGDLVLVASGDPNLSQRVTTDDRLLYRDKDHTYAGFFDAEPVEGDPLQVIRKLARQVAAQGVQEIRGDVIVDDGLFQETKDDFVGCFSAACVNDNVVDITIRPGERAGDPARMDYQPQAGVVHVESEATTTVPGQRTTVWAFPVDNPNVTATAHSPTERFVVRGTVAVDAGPVLRVAPFQHPARTAAGFLASELRSAGVRVAGRARAARKGPGAYGSCDILARHVSPPLSEALRVILKTSHNVHSTMLPVVVGAVKGERGDRREGYRIIARAFEAAGLPSDRVVVRGGSGGSRADLLSALWTVQLLRTLARHRDFRVFFDALPVGGIDGTLHSAFRDSPLEGMVHAKTGTLVYRSTLNPTWVYLSKALSGYIDPVGEGNPDDLLVFSILLANNLTESRSRGAALLVRTQEQILEAVIEDSGTSAAPR